MAPAYRQRYNNQLGSLGADPGASGTTITFAVAPGFPSIADPGYVAIVLDPDTSSEEIVWLTAYTSGATTGTISRGQEGTTAVAHPSGTWRHGPTAKDFWGAQDLSGNLGYYSSGDQLPRLQLVAGSAVKFGPGGSTSPDSTITRLGAGALGMSNATRASVYLNATSQTVTSGAIQLIPVDTANYDPLGGFNASTHQYTVPTTGAYLITGRIKVASAQTSLYCYICRNGNTDIQVGVIWTSQQMGNCCGICVLTVGDTIGLYSSTSATVGLSNGFYLTGFDIMLLGT